MKIPCALAFCTMLSAFGFNAAAEEIVLGDFRRTDSGWQAGNHMKDVDISDKGMSFTVTDNDPWLLGPKVSIPAASADAKKVRFTITCEPTTCDGAWEIYHNLEGKGYDERKKFALRACDATPHAKFSIDMPVKGFSSVEGSFRIDPPALPGTRFTIKSFTAEIIAPTWSYHPEMPPKLSLHGNAIVLNGDGWNIRHDPKRMGAFLYTSHGKTVEGNPGEPCVVAASRRVGDNAPYQVDWANVKPTVTRISDGFVMAAETRDTDGRTWRMTRTFTKVDDGRALAIKTEFKCDKVRALHVPYLTLFAERASNGHKHQAMLAGLEYLDDEPSSSTKDIRMPEANRLIPSLHRITAPFAAG